MTSSIVNYTPHEIVFYDESGKNIVTKLPSVGDLRATEQDSGPKAFIELAGSKFPFMYRKYTGVEGDMPPVVDGRRYLVSYITYQAIQQVYPERHDFVCPDMGKGCVRSDRGQILGTKGFVIY